MRGLCEAVALYSGRAMPSPFDLIAFDGDDTLWHNERSYRDGRERFRRLLAAAGIDLSEPDVEACVNRTELVARGCRCP